MYDGEAVPLATAPEFSRAYAVNDAGEVVGQRQTSAEEIPFLLQGGRLQPLAAGFNGYAARINNAGQIILQEQRENGFGAAALGPGADDRSRFPRRAGPLRSRSQ